jgi:hypothetical protein
VRRHWIVAGIVVIAMLAALFVYRARSRAEVEAKYQVILSDYHSYLKLGMSRSEVEKQLDARGVRFSQVGIGGRPATSDLIKISEENAPSIFCGERNIYVALEFTPLTARQELTAYPSDALSEVRISRVDTCL